jgi:hypothetical protein
MVIIEVLKAVILSNQLIILPVILANSRIALVLILKKNLPDFYKSLFFNSLCDNNIKNK